MQLLGPSKLSLRFVDAFGDNLGGKCAQAEIERDRSGLVENTVPFGIRKISAIQTGIFCRMERVRYFHWIINDGVIYGDGRNGNVLIFRTSGYIESVPGLT